MSAGKIDYSIMLVHAEEADRLLSNYSKLDEIDFPEESEAAYARLRYLASIAHSLAAIAVALTANHMGDEYE